MSSLTSEKYTSLQESYDALVDYIVSALDTDTAFFKKMYKYMINSGNISGRQVCMFYMSRDFLILMVMTPCITPLFQEV